ncbi:hypothetical protein DFH28DRAFT_1106135 [Melampsora americana]|nr:hypothetical protein DFH28DRAFT_1106135 [Melampsora americana]
MYCLLFQSCVLLIFSFQSFVSCRNVFKRQLTDPCTTWGRADTCAGVIDNQYRTDLGSSTDILLHDLRKCDAPILQKDGFTVVKRSPNLHKLTPFSNSYKAALQRDSIQLVKDLTGSSMAICFSYADRGASDEDSLGPYSLIHSDLSIKGAESLKEELERKYIKSPYKRDRKFGQSIKDGKRLVVFNVWRPIKIVKDNPLAICDWNSIKEEDKMEFGLKPTSHGNAIQTWKYGDHQRWVYLPDQKPEEVFVFIQHDSHGKDGHGINVPHASVVLKGQEDKPSSRQSYEFRIAVIMKDSNEPGLLQKLLSWLPPRFASKKTPT